MIVRTRVGDVFSVQVDEEHQKFFQYIANDLTQLNSDVIRAFREPRSNSEPLDLSAIVEGEVDFYAHCMIKVGLKQGRWAKVGTAENVGDASKLVFRDTGDFGKPGVTRSDDWWIWRLNEPQVRVGKLDGANTKAEIGLVFNADNIVHRMKTGVYSQQGYPSY